MNNLVRDFISGDCLGLALGIITPAELPFWQLAVALVALIVAIDLRASRNEK